MLQASADLSALPSDASASVRRTLELCFEKDARKRIADMRDVRLGLAGAFAPAAPTPAPVQPLWRRALPFAATLVVGLLLASVYFLGSRPPAVPANVAAPAPVSRFVITPPATAPLANQGGLDLAISPDGKRIVYLAVKPESGKRRALRARARCARGAADSGHGSAERRAVEPVLLAGRKVRRLSRSRPRPRQCGDRWPTADQDRRSTEPGFTGGWWAGDNTVIYSSVRRLQRVSAAGGGTPVPLMPERQTGAVAAPVLLPGGRAVLFHAFGDDRGGSCGRARSRHRGRENRGRGRVESCLRRHGPSRLRPRRHADGGAVQSLGARRDGGAGRARAGHSNGPRAARPTTRSRPTVRSPTYRGAPRRHSVLAVVWVDRTGKVIGRAVPDLIANPRDPRLSPDGKRLLLVTGPDNDGDLWNYDLSGRPPIPLALPNDNRSPVWSPDGKQVAFTRCRMNAVMVLSADGSERTPRSLHAQIYLAPQVWSAAGELF